MYGITFSLVPSVHNALFINLLYTLYTRMLHAVFMICQQLFYRALAAAKEKPHL